MHINKTTAFITFELMDVIMKDGRNSPLRVVVIYRPPRTEGCSTANTFFEEFSAFLEEILLCPQRMIIVGDFNFHVNDTLDREGQTFLDLITSVNLNQHVMFPTHESGNTLDLLLTRASENLISDVTLSSHLPSDHCAVISFLDLGKFKDQRLTIASRKISEIDLDSFRSDILESELRLAPADDVDTLIEQYNSTLSRLLNKHAPLKTRSIPFYSPTSVVKVVYR